MKSKQDMADWYFKHASEDSSGDFPWEVWGNYCLTHHFTKIKYNVAMRLQSLKDINDDQGNNLIEPNRLRKIEEIFMNFMKYIET